MMELKTWKTYLNYNRLDLFSILKLELENVFE